MKKVTTDINNDIYLLEEMASFNNLDEYLDNVIQINKDKVINKYIGMGGAITNATSYNYSLLNKGKKSELIKLLFSKKYLNYNFGRISIGSNDFCLYSYEYIKDKNIDAFDISEDEKYVIPMLKDILKEKSISLIASPWSPPSFMKYHKSLYNGDKLKKKYYKLYSEYLLKFIDIYKENNIKINYLTIQNEPYAYQSWESCYFSLKEQKKFIYKYLLDKLNDVKVIMHDHNREDLTKITRKLYSDKVNILGVHYYTKENYEEIKYLHDTYKNLLIFNTEMCCGFSKYDKIKWVSDAEYYLKDIISSFNSGINAYLDWNLLLDYNGGPSYIKNYCKSIIILNKEKNDYILTPIYYYIYHISHFFYNEDNIVLNENNDNSLYVLSSIKENDIKITILNIDDKEHNYNIVIDDKYIKDIIKPHSIITYYSK